MEINPQGKSEGQFRVYRGGRWNNLAKYSRVKGRTAHCPETHGNEGGFRIVMKGIKDGQRRNKS